MITKEKLDFWAFESTKDDEYDGLCWGSKERTQQLIKEVRRLNKKLDALHAEEEQ